MAWGRKTEDVGWTDRDTVLLHTLLITHSLLEDRLHERPFIASRFALTEPGERVLAAGPYDLHWWGAMGDGSWATGGSVLVAGTGKLGLGLAAASLIADGRAKSRARVAAADDAAVRWRPVDQGIVHISTHAFYLTDGVHGHRRFDWEAVQQVDMLGPGVAQFTAITDHGSATWRLAGSWAELLFAVWVVTRQHPHPQWLDGSWYPYDTMRQRSTYYGYALPALPG